MSDAVQGAIELGVFLVLVVLVGLGMRGRLPEESMSELRHDDREHDAERGAVSPPVRHRVAA